MARTASFHDLTDYVCAVGPKNADLGGKRVKLRVTTKGMKESRIHPRGEVKRCYIDDSDMFWRLYLKTEAGEPDYEVDMSLQQIREGASEWVQPRVYEDGPVEWDDVGHLSSITIIGEQDG